jgi:hypothetical protein
VVYQSPEESAETQVIKWALVTKEKEKTSPGPQRTYLTPKDGLFRERMGQVRLGFRAEIRNFFVSTQAAFLCSPAAS